MKERSLDEPTRHRLTQFLAGSREAAAATSVAAAAEVGATARVARLVEFGRAHLRVVALVGVGAVVVGCFLVLRARPVAADIPVLSVASPSLIIAASPTPTPAPQLRIHILGAVASPGVVTLPVGCRVADVIQAAGGLTSNANPGELNLAALVPDGAQIIIGSKSNPRGELRVAEPAPGGSSGGLLDLNTATAEQLDALPGVGPVTAQAILSWRTKHKRFNSVAELQEVDGIGPKTYAELAPLVRV